MLLTYRCSEETIKPLWRLLFLRCRTEDLPLLQVYVPEKLLPWLGVGEECLIKRKFVFQELAQNVQAGGEIFIGMSDFYTMGIAQKLRPKKKREPEKKQLQPFLLESDL